MALFGTDGIRGRAGEILTPHLAFRLGAFLGSYNKINNILIAMDTRISGPLLLNSLSAGILSSGGNVAVLGIAPTPALAYICKKHNYDYGIMISASHNPFADNGIKVFDTNGFKISKELETQLEEYIVSSNSLPIKQGKEIGHFEDKSDLLSEYVTYLKAAYRDTLNFKILVDGANGSASTVIKETLADMKLSADIINITPNGININDNCGSTHLNKLQDLMLQNKGKYDLGVAFDGDADRVLLVGPNGEEINGDHVLFVLAKHYKKENTLTNNVVVTTIMSNLGLFNALEKLGIQVVKTNVGDKYIQKEIIDHDYLIGGEQSGHTIFNGYIKTGDGIFTLMKILDVLAANKTTLSEFTKEFTMLPQVLVNVKVVDKDKAATNPQLLSRIAHYESILENTGRILVRKSGTEHLVRVMVEAHTEKEARDIAADLATFVK